MANPYLINVHDLVGRPGYQRTVSLTLPAQPELGVGLARVPEGAPIEVELRLESVHEGILASATVDFDVEGESSRTLEPLKWHDEAEFHDLFVYPDAEAAQHTGDATDDEVQILRGDHVDLSQSIRDAIVLSLPFTPQGDEPESEVYSVGEFEEEEPEEQLDPRWAALGGLHLQGHAEAAAADGNTSRAEVAEGRNEG